MKQSTTFFGTAGLVVCVLAPLTRAGPVTWQVTGVVTEIRDPYGELGGLVRVGDDLVASYTFISTTQDSVLYDPTRGRYDNSVESITGFVGSIHFASKDPFGQISIANNFVATGDGYGVGLGGLTTNVFDYATEFWLSLDDPSGLAFDSDALPLTPPSLEAFESRLFYVTIGSDRIVINGQVTSLVPEPTSLVFVAIGVAALVVRRGASQRGRAGMLAILILFVPQLLLAQQWPSTNGPVLIGGDDADDHFEQTNYPTGKNYIRHGFNFLGAHVLNDKTKVVCIGCNGTQKATTSFNTAFDASMLSPLQGGGWSPAIITSETDIQGFFANINPVLGPPNIQDTGIIYLPSDYVTITGGILAVQLNVVNENAGILTAYVQSGGGLFTHTLADLDIGLTFPKYAWLTALAPNVQPVELTDTDCPFVLTCAATRAFFPTMTVDEQVSIAFANWYHTYFQPASGSDLSGLTVVGQADTGHAVTLGAPYVAGADCNANFARDDCDIRWNTPKFTLYSSLPTGDQPKSVIVTSVLPTGKIVPLDLNDDGNADLVTANFGGNSLTIYLGMGTGGFLPPSPSSLGTFALGSPTGLGAVDFDGNGVVDLVVTRDASPGFVYFVRNRGLHPTTRAWQGFATNPPFVSVGNRPLRIAVADLDTDGDSDVVTANDGDGSLSILRNDGLGNFSLANTIDAGTSGPKGIALADLDLDGDRDIVAAPGSESKLWFFPNTGSLTFGPRQDFEVGVNNDPVSVVIGNFNDDAYPDVVTGPGNSIVTHRLTILVNGGLNGSSWVGLNVSPGPAIPSAKAADSLVAVDLNHDRRTDVAWAYSSAQEREAWVFAQDPYTHQLISPRSSSCGSSFLPIDGHLRSIASGLFNSDFRQDLAVVTTFDPGFPGRVYVFINDSEPPYSQDCDLDQTPDDCEGLATLSPKNAPGEAGFPKQRFLSVVPDNPGRLTALRVTPIRMPSWKFMTLIGSTLWATHQPQSYCESSGIAQPPCGSNPATFWAARLDCSPMVRLWNYSVPLSPLSLYHGATSAQFSAIVPGATYMVQTFADGCDFTREPNYLPPTIVQTARFGDVAGSYMAGCTSPPCWPAPDGAAPSVTVDTQAVLEKFGNRYGGLMKARADVEPAAVDLKVNISDVVWVLNAFRNLPYPYPLPTGPLCP